MGLNAAERKQLKSLQAKCLDDEGKPVEGASDEDLKHLQELLDKANAGTKKEPKPRKFEMSETGQALVDDGADFLGWEPLAGKKHAEYFYQKDADGVQHAIMVVDNEDHSVGRVFGDTLLAKLRQ